MRRWAFEVGYAILVLAAAALILSLVGRRPGWPLGDASTEELILVHLYAAHFRHLDFFPVWSSSDGVGLGTPVLLYYQKTFFYVSGAIYVLLGGALKPTLIASVTIFLVVGAYGMRRALEMVTDSRLLCIVGSLGFLFTNYVFTDWVSRGDLAEFSAMMIVPWLLFWCLNLIQNRRVSMVLIPVLALLVEAHSAIALLSILVLVVAMITFVAVAGLGGLRAAARRLIIAAGATTLILAPTLVAELRMAQSYDPASKVTHGAGIAQDFLGFGSYFYDSSYRWLAGGQHLVQIDFAIWIPIAVALIGVGVYWARRRTRPDTSILARYVDVPSVLFLVVSLLVFLVLQLRITLEVYRVLAPLQVIDYPFRMLAFITPIGVILVVALGNALIRRYPTRPAPKVVAVIWLVSLVLLSPITSTWTTQYPYYLAPHNQFPSIALSSPPASVDYQHFRGFATFGGILYDEYLPKVYQNGSELYDDGLLYRELHNHQDGAASLSGGPCSVQVPSNAPLESLRLTFKVRCSGATRLALPISYNAFTKVYASEGRAPWRQIPYFRVPSDPRIIISVGTSQSESVEVHLPTLWGILS